MSRVLLVAACYRTTDVLVDDAVTVILLLARLEDSMQLPCKLHCDIQLCSVALLFLSM